MNTKSYYAKMTALINKDYAVMMKMLDNADPNKHPISEETIPTLQAVKEIFLEDIEKNIQGMLQFKALVKVLTDKELTFDEDAIAWEVDTTTEEDEPKGNIYM